MLSHYFIAPKTPLLSCPSNFIHFWVVFYFIFFLHRLLILIGFLLTFARKLMRLPPGRQYRRSLPASAQTLHSIMVMSYVIIKHDILCKRIQLSTVALPFLFYQIKKKLTLMENMYMYAIKGLKELFLNKQHSKNVASKMIQKVLLRQVSKYHQ